MPCGPRPHLASSWAAVPDTARTSESAPAALSGTASTSYFLGHRGFPQLIWLNTLPLVQLSSFSLIELKKPNRSAEAQLTRTMYVYVYPSWERKIETD